MKTIHSTKYDIEHDLSGVRKYSHSLPTWQRCIPGGWSSEEIAKHAASADHGFNDKPYRIVRVTEEKEVVYQSGQGSKR